MKAEFESNGQTIEVDFSDMEKRLLEKLTGDTKAKMEEYFKETRIATKTASKGVVEGFSPDAKKIILEEFHKGEGVNAQRIKEQWTICIPHYAVNELAGHLRDYVWVTDAVKGISEELFNIGA